MSISPRFETLEQAIASKDLEKVREAFKKMNSTWTINESVVRYNSIAHYGQLIMDVLKQLFPFCLVAWKPNLQMSLEHENSS
ncbi:high-affinity Fe2+/Pb2+ permease [Streptococcus pneumoniae]|nr:high-affinity Fe2+/Pb2+ permease [Streptococcus pneumoniae]